MSDVQKQQAISVDAAERVRAAKRELDFAILDVIQAGAIVGRGPGGQEVSTAIQYARTASLWLGSAVQGDTGNTEAPSNHGFIARPGT